MGEEIRGTDRGRNQTVRGEIERGCDGMKTGRKLIGVCGARIFEQNAMMFLEEMRKMGKKHGYFPIAFYSSTDSMEENEETKAEGRLFELCRYVDLCALVILTETLKNKMLIRQIVEIGRQKEIPVFTVDGSLEGCYNLVLDYIGGFEKVARHIVEDHKARYVNMLAGFQGNSFSDERIAVYRKVLEENGIPFEEERVGYGDFWERPTRKAVKKFLESDLPRPEAIVCANDSMAITTCAVLKENGVRIPRDIMVTGFDGIQNAKYHTPIICTCEPTYEESLEFLFREIKKAEETGNIQPCDFSVEFSLIPSQSCGCMPKTFYDRNGIISTLFSEVGDCAWHNMAMNEMVESVLDKEEITEIASILPDSVKPWSDHFHFACVRAELTRTYKTSREYSRLVTILRGDSQEFEEPGEQFPVTQFIPRLDELIREGSGTDVLVVRLLNSGKDIYGYIIEGFQQLEGRRLQRSNEFAMFLSHSINTVLHNNMLKKLNENLTMAYNEISFLYLQDAMTGIYNRRGFYKMLNRLLNKEENQGKYLNIVSVDMDGLKYINDNFGHAEGDFAITTMAKAMSATGGEDAICARFGGDEFICALLSDEENSIDRKEWNEKINAHIAELPHVKEKPYPIQASVGISCSQVEKGVDADSMILSADKQMYQDKVDRKKQRTS